MSDDPMRILVVEPTKDQYVKEIDGSLTSMQAIVGGFIQAVEPFDDHNVLLLTRITALSSSHCNGHAPAICRSWSVLEFLHLLCEWSLISVIVTYSPIRHRASP